MEAIKFCLSFILLVLSSAQHGAATSCRMTCQTIKDELSGAPSGKYLTSTKAGIPFEIHCEMGLNGGGYTFLPPYVLTYLQNDELSAMFTNRTSFLLRVRTANGTQPYGVLTQLSEHAATPLMLSINNHTDYYAPVNKETIGEPYLYFGFLPIAAAGNNSLKGLEINGKRFTFDNCNRTPSGQITLFPNFREVQPSSTYVPGPALSNLMENPSGREMTTDYFMFGEIQFGGCGCDTKTCRSSEILSVAIGFR